MASPGGSDGSPQEGLQASSSRDITMSCKLQNATSLTMRELQEITDNFSKERAIGEGAYGKVYRGALDNGEEIAVKLLHNRLESDDGQFRREFENLMRLEHHNIVRLVGYCYETQHKPMIYTGHTIFAEEISKALCFEYMQNGSLEKHLSEEYDGLDWHTRYKIIKGTCEGLQYLHEGFKEPIYHLDLKPDNILLDENMVPKLADFGLSRLFGGQQTMMTQSILGTIGYMPPEYLFGNIISNKFDVFSLGVVMTKIIAGPRGHTRRAEMSRQEFLDQVQKNWRNRLQGTWSSRKPLEAHCEQVIICTEIALSCMEHDRQKRPNIADIINQLNDTEAIIDKALSWSASSQSWMQGDLMKVCAFTRSKAIPDTESCSEFPVLVRVTAAPWLHAEEMPRAGVDIVAVLDVNRIRLLQWKVRRIKEAMMIVIDKLSPNDRLSIVSVEDKAHCVMKLTFMSDQGRDAAKLMLNKMAGNCGNDMVTALQEGVEILRGRELEEGGSRIGCIMLVSDSNYTGVLTQEISSEFPVHTIGVELHHRPQVMKYIADKTSGTYSFLNHDRMFGIEEAFKIFITGITSVVVTSIKITLTAHDGVTISSIESGGYDNLVSSDKRSGLIDINNMYAGERKNFIVYLTVAEGHKKLVTIGGQYRSFDTSKQLADKDVFVLRPLSGYSPDKLAINREVAGELTRIRLLKGLLAIAELNYDEVGFHLMQELWNRTRSCDEGRGATKETLWNLGNDMTEMERSICWYPKTEHYTMSWLSCHKWQRATTKGSFYDQWFIPVSRGSGQHAGGDVEDNDDD